MRTNSKTMLTCIMLFSMLFVRSVPAFIPTVSKKAPGTVWHRLVCRASSSSTSPAVVAHISRLDTLQELLAKYGAPGSEGCRKPSDLIAVEAPQLRAIDDSTPELVYSLSGNNELADVHPFLFPIAKSKSTGNFICAYHNPLVEDSERKSTTQPHPWPIVEAKVRSPGFRLLALNSEHLMRRIACESDESGLEEIISLYNEGLGQGRLNDPALDTAYEPGSVAKLGYGVDKYVLLRVGPFPDLYESMVLQHVANGDEQSALIAAETSSKKLPGFASTFLSYARLLKSLSNRDEEARDAARMCLRLPLSTVGMTADKFKEVAVLGQIAQESDDLREAIAKLRSMYEKMKEIEREDDTSQQGKTPEQKEMDEIVHIIDVAALSETAWSSIRLDIAQRLRTTGRDDMARFIDFST